MPKPPSIHPASRRLGLFLIFMSLVASSYALDPDITQITVEPPVPQIQPLHLQVMTYNLKFASESGAHPWSQRRRLVRDAIRGQAPDLIGTQEGVDGQLSDIVADLPQYARIGTGREGGQKGEFAAILYKKNRFKLLDHGDFWLSPTPEVAGSRGWGNTQPRMVTWALFEDNASGARFYHFNTHFDFLFPFVRTKSADLMSRRIAGRKLNLPVVVTGDFNTNAASRAHAILTPAALLGGNTLVDTFTTAEKNEGRTLSTFHNWKGPHTGSNRIDWILTTPQFECRSTRVITFNEEGIWPSDHFPVVSDITLESKPQTLEAKLQAASRRI